MGTEPAATWITFDEQPEVPGRKTKVFIVRTKGNEVEPVGVALGRVSWWGAWRKYAFFPLPNTLYEPTCMRDIAGFLDGLMRERRDARRRTTA